MKKLLWIALILIAGALMVYHYVFHKPHRDVANEAASIQTSAQQLVGEFKTDRGMADSIYLDQVVALKGVLSALEKGALSLEAGVYVKLDSLAQAPTANIGDSIEVQGRVIGFDDLFEEVRLDFAKVLN